MRSSMFLSILLFWGLAAGQGDSTKFRFPGEQRFGKAQMYLDDGENTFVKASQLAIVNDSLFVKTAVSYEGGGGTRSQMYHIDNVYVIRVSKGTYAAEYCILGALSAGLTAFLSFSNTGSDPYSSAVFDKETRKNFTLGFTLGGAIIGGIWGASTQKWSTLYRKNDLSKSTLKINYRLAYSPQRQSVLLKMTLGYF